MNVQRGDVVAYHPVIGLPHYIRVRVLEDPWALGSGDMITKVRGCDDDKIYRPCLDALAPLPSSDTHTETKK